MAQMSPVWYNWSLALSGSLPKEETAKFSQNSSRTTLVPESVRIEEKFQVLYQNKIGFSSQCEHSHPNTVKPYQIEQVMDKYFCRSHKFSKNLCAAQATSFHEIKHFEPRQFLPTKKVMFYDVISFYFSVEKEDLDTMIWQIIYWQIILL